MDDEDWGATANAAVFTLFRNAKPEEEAVKDGFVDSIVYNRWTKAERRLYSKIKAQRVAQQIAQNKIESLDDITNTMKGLNLLKDSGDPGDPTIENLITQMRDMELRQMRHES